MNPQFLDLTLVQGDVTMLVEIVDRDVAASIVVGALEITLEQNWCILHTTFCTKLSHLCNMYVSHLP